MTTPPMLVKEELVGLAALAKSVPSRRRCGPVGSHALYRWATKGVKARDGSTVRLEAVMCAGRLLSSREALQRFIAAQNPISEGVLLPNIRPPGRRLQESERASAALAEVGI